MKKFNLYVSIAAILVVSAGTAKAQSLYGISQLKSNNMNYLSQVDISNGAVTIVSTNPLSQYVNGASSMDTLNKRFFFVSSGDTLCTVDLVSGNLLAKNKISLHATHQQVHLEFNCMDGILYGITQQKSNNMDFLSRVDPLTGNITIISTTALSKYVNSCSSIDPINKQFIYMSTNDTLCTVDLVSGNLLAKNRISLSATHQNVLHEFNVLDSKLYAITQQKSDNMNYLSTVDPLTGNVTLISTTALSKYAASLSSIDPVNNQFVFSSAGDTLYNVDLVTGNLISKNKNSLSATNMINLLEFEKPCPFLSDVENLSHQTKFTIYPNPSDGLFHVDLGQVYSDVTIKITDIQGRTIKREEAANQQHFEVELNETAGIYLVHVLSDNQELSVIRVVKE